jgi:hypothetical protein
MVFETFGNPSFCAWNEEIYLDYIDLVAPENKEKRSAI